MRNEQREDEGEHPDAHDDALVTAHEAQHVVIGDAAAETRGVHGVGDQVRADDQPQGRTGPGIKYLCRLRDSRDDEQYEVQTGRVTGLSDLARPEDDGHKTQGKALLAFRSQPLERSKPDDEAQNDTSDDADLALGNLHGCIPLSNLNNRTRSGEPPNAAERGSLGGKVGRAPVTSSDAFARPGFRAGYYAAPTPITPPAAVRAELPEA